MLYWILRKGQVIYKAEYMSIFVHSLQNCEALRSYSGLLISTVVCGFLLVGVHACIMLLLHLMLLQDFFTATSGLHEGTICNEKDFSLLNTIFLKHFRKSKAWRNTNESPKQLGFFDQ